MSVDMVTLLFVGIFFLLATIIIVVVAYDARKTFLVLRSERRNEQRSMSRYSY